MLRPTRGAGAEYPNREKWVRDVAAYLCCGPHGAPVLNTQIVRSGCVMLQPTWRETACAHKATTSPTHL